MKSWLRPVLFFPALSLFFALAPGPLATAQPAPAEEPKENSSRKAPELDQAELAVAATAAAAAERSMADEIQARAAEIRRRAEETRQRIREEETRQRIRAEEDRNRAREGERRTWRTDRDVVNVFGDASLPAGEGANNVVAVFGSATSEGEINDSMVAVFGNLTASGPVGDNAVAVFGNVEVTSRVDEAVVSVFGNVTVNSRVGRVVAVFGNVELGPKAEIDGEVVCVMGQVKRDPAAIVHHQITGFGENLTFSAGLGTWVRECLLKGRPLAFDSSLGWAWMVAGSFLVLYLLLALIFRGGMEKCVETLGSRPGGSMLTALGAVVLTPVAIVLLCITVVGVLVVPFFAAALFLAGLFGKAVVLAWVGRRLLRPFGMEAAHPALAVLFGGVLVLALYTVPVLGFISYKIFGWLGLGAVLFTLLIARRREKPVAAAMTGSAAVAGMPGSAAGTAPAGWPDSGIVSPAPGMPPPPPPVVSAITTPRAGFWIRFAAMCLDLFLLAILAAFTTGHWNLAPFGIVAYAALMWKLKGTTIGGVVCNLKVVRIDGREVDWSTAIVRALGCFLSLVVFGLGFIWVAIDDEKQSWHDKIAGTTVVRVPKGVSLL